MRFVRETVNSDIRVRSSRWRHSGATKDTRLAEVRRDASPSTSDRSRPPEASDASVGVLRGDLPDEGRDPGVVRFEQAQKRPSRRRDAVESLRR